MSARGLILAAALGLAACGPDLPDRVGALAPCETIDLARFEAGQGGRINAGLGPEGWRAQGSGHAQKRCWPRVGGGARGERRCVQQNDLYVRLEDGAGVRYAFVPRGATYLLYDRDGAAICEIVNAER